MTPLQRSFAVDFTYRVDFTRDLFAPTNPLWASVLRRRPGVPARCAVVVDDGVAAHHPGLVGRIEAYARAHAGAITLAAPPRVVRGGEACKNDPAAVDEILGLLHEGDIDRHAYVVAVGGGALLDLVGFAAAICHRGVRLVRVPTTVLAQNDSGVGVKNSVNRFGKKNFLGTFAPPDAVLVDPGFLTTLDDRDWRAGTAEAVKVALLKDPGFFAWLEAHAAALRGRDLAEMEQLVHRCADLHMAHIAGAGDPFEQGSSRPLDFGHWSAHKLEQRTAFEVRHGEAVATGIALDVAYCVELGWLDEVDAQRVWRCLAALGLPLTHPAQVADDGGLHPALVDGLEEFRQHLGGELTIMLLQGIGRGVEVHEMRLDVLDRAARRIGAWAP